MATSSIEGNAALEARNVCQKEDRAVAGPWESELRSLADRWPSARRNGRHTKDVHLIEAALNADRIVASLDENARMLFHTAELNVVTWVNPVSERLRIRAWLEEGAPPVDEWKLGHRP